MRRLLIAGLVVVAALPAAATARAANATARFTATLEAERTVSWDQPRGVGLIDCHGENWSEYHGEETWKIKTRKSFAVTVTKLGRLPSWQFGKTDLKVSDPRMLGIEASGIRTRDYTHRSGSTGGWCGGETTYPAPKTDCGTRLPTNLLRLSAYKGEVSWIATQAPWTNNEKLDFYSCTLIVPEGLSVGSFPDLKGRVGTADVFNPRKRTLTVRASKSYGPQRFPLANIDVERTARGSASWTLKLTRVRR